MDERGGTCTLKYRMIKMSVSKPEEKDRICIKLQDENLHSFNCSPSIIRTIKQRRLTWERHVACMGIAGMEDTTSKTWM
jgi:hypothetical protein